PNDLLDKRQVAIDTLARLTGATPYTNAAGDVSMALPGGTALVTEGSAGRLSAVQDPTNSGHLKLQMIRADGSPAFDIPTPLRGEVRGLRSARHGARRARV